jgi:hypothetical protein
LVSLSLLSSISQLAWATERGEYREFMALRYHWRGGVGRWVVEVEGRYWESGGGRGEEGGGLVEVGVGAAASGVALSPPPPSPPPPPSGTAAAAAAAAVGVEEVVGGEGALTG